MKKSARKILSLVLSLVLICTISATAFAVTYVETEEGFYHFDMLATASIQQYSTSVTVEASNYGEVDTIGGDIICVYTYRWLIQPDDTSLEYAIVSERKVVPNQDRAYNYTKEFNAIRDNIYDMRHASYDVDVLVTNSRGSYEFAPDTLVVTYPF